MADDLEAIQDAVTFRRLSAWELHRLSTELQQLKEALPAGKLPPWMPIIFGALLTMATSYIGIVHQMALTNRAEIQRIGLEQANRSFLKTDIEDLKRRLLVNETLAQQIPALVQYVRDINSKLDRLLERPRGGAGFP